MDYLIQLGKASSDSAPITRNLADGADYSPNWRYQVFEQHLVKIAKAKDESAAIEKALAEERDPVLRQLFLYHFDRPCTIKEALHYAFRCQRSSTAKRTALAIEGMVIANRTHAEIAEQAGCKDLHVLIYEKLFFDVRRYLKNWTWVKLHCYGAAPEASRYLVSAFERGWPGLAAIISKAPPHKSPAGKNELEKLQLGSLARCGDFVTQSEIEGVTPGARDLESLSTLLQLLPKDQERFLRLARLDYPKPLTVKEVAEKLATEELVSGLSLESRKKLTRILMDLEEKMRNQPTC